VVARPFIALLADGFVAAPDYGGVRIVFRGVQADRADRRARGGGFHQRLAAGQYDAIYDNAAPAFRTSLNRSDSAKFFTAIRKKMGDCKTPVGAISFFTNANTSGTSVQLRYRLECASGALDETLVYVVTGDGPRLVGYNANSPALVLR
jgi:hypothetical protein